MKLSLATLPLAVAAALLLAVPAANAHGTRYTANLGNFENPATGSPGTGFAIVEYNDEDHMLYVAVSFSGLLGNVTNSHIHCCTAAPGNTGVATPTPSFPGFPSGVTHGFYERLFDLTLASSYNNAFRLANGGTPASAETALIAGFDAGKAYWNIHTTRNGGGEIRGFLTPVPEPATYGLMALGLGVIGVVARRRKAA